MTKIKPDLDDLLKRYKELEFIINKIRRDITTTNTITIGPPIISVLPFNALMTTAEKK